MYCCCSVVQQQQCAASLHTAKDPKKSVQTYDSYQVLMLLARRDGYRVVIVGGGAAGLTTASHYARKLPNAQVAVIEVRRGQQDAAATEPCTNP